MRPATGCAVPDDGKRRPFPLSLRTAKDVPHRCGLGVRSVHGREQDWLYVNHEIATGMASIDVAVRPEGGSQPDALQDIEDLSGPLVPRPELSEEYGS